MSPPEACSMIETFLFTETTHDQTLRVESIYNDNDGSGPICKKMKMDSTQPLPASNGTFKTLDILAAPLIIFMPGCSVYLIYS